MDTLSQKLKNMRQTPYQVIAEEYGVTAKYVGMIARGERAAVRGKALEIKKALEEMFIEN